MSQTVSSTVAFRAQATHVSALYLLRLRWPLSSLSVAYQPGALVNFHAEEAFESQASFMLWEDLRGVSLFRLPLCISRGSLLAVLSMERVGERRRAGNRPKNQGTSQLESGLSCVDSLFGSKLSPRMADIVYLNVG